MAASPVRAVVIAGCTYIELLHGSACSAVSSSRVGYACQTVIPVLPCSAAIASVCDNALSIWLPLQALAAEKEAIAHEKEMEVARLRAMQEKQADHQSEQDELRARRYQVGSPEAMIIPAELQDCWLS